MNFLMIWGLYFALVYGIFTIYRGLQIEGKKMFNEEFDLNFDDIELDEEEMQQLEAIEASLPEPSKCMQRKFILNCMLHNIEFKKETLFFYL